MIAKWLNWMRLERASRRRNKIIEATQNDSPICLFHDVAYSRYLSNNVNRETVLEMIKNGELIFERKSDYGFSIYKLAPDIGP